MFYAVNATDGSKKWSFNAGERWHAVSSQAQVSKDGSTVYFGSFDGYLYALDTADGSKKWALNAAPGIVGIAPAVSEDGNVLYVGSGDDTNGNVRALNTKDGSEKWTFATNGS